MSLTQRASYTVLAPRPFSATRRSSSGTRQRSVQIRPWGLYAQSVFAMLAMDDLHAIFSLLPVDQRLRCREMCPEWREALAYPLLWCFCDISQPDSGVAPRSVSGFLALLRTESRDVRFRKAGFLERIGLRRARVRRRNRELQ